MQTPPDNERNRRGGAIQAMRGLFYGEAGKEVVVEYLDAKGRPLRVAVQLAPRSGSACAQLDPLVPPGCASTFQPHGGDKALQLGIGNAGRVAHWQQYPGPGHASKVPVLFRYGEHLGMGLAGGRRRPAQ